MGDFLSVPGTLCTRECDKNESGNEITCETKDGEQSCGTRIQDHNFQVRYTKEGYACATYPEGGRCRSVSWNFIEAENKVSQSITNCTPQEL